MNNSIGFLRRKVDILRRSVRNIVLAQPNVQTTQLSDLHQYAHVFDPIEPWAGRIPKGFRVDFLGTMTRMSFENLSVDPYQKADSFLQIPRPALGQSPDKNGEFWFEAADWVLAALDASDSYTMVTLGACFGYQAVGAYRALCALNPMPCRLVAVDPIPENIEWTRLHFEDNGIDPDDHWLIEAAVTAGNDPVLFPVGAPGAGMQNCVSTNTKGSRESYLRELAERGTVEAALRSLLLANSTSITTDISGGNNLLAEIKLVSSLSLPDILGPFDRVDFIEADMQESEIVVFPPYLDLLKKKVRRIHLGTHGRETHRALHGMFAERGWDIVFSFEPDGVYHSELGLFKTNDGVLTVRNPTL
jgi:hypothetical protein